MSVVQCSAAALQRLAQCAFIEARSAMLGCCTTMASAMCFYCTKCVVQCSAAALRRELQCDINSDTENRDKENALVTMKCIRSAMYASCARR